MSQGRQDFNEEVRNGLFKDLLPFYVRVRRGTVRAVIDYLTRQLLVKDAPHRRLED